MWWMKVFKHESYDKLELPEGLSGLLSRSESDSTMHVKRRASNLPF